MTSMQEDNISLVEYFCTIKCLLCKWKFDLQLFKKYKQLIFNSINNKLQKLVIVETIN